jgi:hypothetical protein
MVHISGGGITGDISIFSLILGAIVGTPIMINRAYFKKYQYKASRLTLNQIAKRYGPYPKPGFRAVWKWAEKNEFIRYVLFEGRTPPGITSLDEMLDWR